MRSFLLSATLKDNNQKLTEHRSSCFSDMSTTAMSLRDLCSWVYDVELCGSTWFSLLTKFRWGMESIQRTLIEGLNLGDRTAVLNWMVAGSIQRREYTWACQCTNLGSLFLSSIGTSCFLPRLCTIRTIPSLVILWCCDQIDTGQMKLSRDSEQFIRLWYNWAYPFNFASLVVTRNHLQRCQVRRGIIKDVPLRKNPSDSSNTLHWKLKGRWSLAGLCLFRVEICASSSRYRQTDW